MPQKSDFNVAIIGAGLTGLGLAIALQSHGIDCTVYEASPSPEQVVKGSLGLGPNGQAALASLNILSQIEKWSVFLQHGTVHDKSGNVMGEILLGNKEHFGYDALRILRARLVDELVQAAADRGVSIHCNKKFTRIVSKSSTNGAVTVEFADGTTSTTSLVLAADGIHSRIRQALHPTIQTNYIGTIVVTGSVSKSAMPELTDTPIGMYINPGTGTAILGPHAPNNEDWIIGFQSPYPDLGSTGWKEFQADKTRLRAYLETGKKHWPSHVQNAIAHAREDSLFLWPMYTLPQLPTWLSEGKRIVLVGDAAHAMPPTAGQGANQAFEDAYTLGLVLAAVKDKGKDLGQALEFWQAMRMDRITSVVELAMQWNKMRQPEKEQNTETLGTAALESERITQMKWLYGGLSVQEEKIKSWAGEK